MDMFHICMNIVEYIYIYNMYVNIFIYVYIYISVRVCVAPLKNTMCLHFPLVFTVFLDYV